MAGMRVLQLAKEYGLTNREMLDKVVELGIPAKSHASPLNDEQVAQVREALGDPNAADDGASESAERPLTKEEMEAKEREAEEERRRKKENSWFNKFKKNLTKFGKDIVSEE
jgi:translation initiation factor IF-2